MNDVKEYAKALGLSNKAIIDYAKKNCDDVRISYDSKDKEFTLYERLENKFGQEVWVNVESSDYKYDNIFIDDVLDHMTTDDLDKAKVQEKKHSHTRGM